MDSDPTRDLLGLTMELALGEGVGALPRLEYLYARIPRDAIPPDLELIYAATLDAIKTGKPPTLRLLRSQFPNETPAFWASLEPQFASLESARDAVMSEYFDSIAGGMVDRLASLRKKGAKLEELLAYVDRTRARISSLGADARDGQVVRVLDTLDSMAEGRMPVVKTGFKQLDTAMGGGLFFGGDNSLSAVLAYSGVGKTAFARQVSLQALSGGHWLAYFSGESSNEITKMGLVRLRAGLPKGAIAPGVKLIGGNRNRAANAEAWLDGKNAFFYDRGFDTATIRGILMNLLGRLDLARAEGKAPSHARLFAVIDNLDHVTGDEDESHKTALNATRDLAMFGAQHDCHILCLCQADEEGYRRGRAPTLNEFAVSKKMVKNFSTIITLYRPSFGDTREEKGKPEMALPKTRSGTADTFNIFCDELTGSWVQDSPARDEPLLS